jgi:hypothetical protein
MSCCNTGGRPRADAPLRQGGSFVAREHARRHENRIGLLRAGTFANDQAAGGARTAKRPNPAQIDLVQFLV